MGVMAEMTAVMMMAMVEATNLKKQFISTLPVLLWVLPLLFLVSCSDDESGNDMMVGPVEDISYLNDIQPIFNGSCGGAGCHIGSSKSGVNLSSYDDVMDSSGQQYGRTIVEPEQPGESPLVDKIGPNPSQGERMPLNGSPLSDLQIQMIRVWIEEGARNN